MFTKSCPLCCSADERVRIGDASLGIPGGSRVASLSGRGQRINNLIFRPVSTVEELVEIHGTKYREEQVLQSDEKSY